MDKQTKSLIKRNIAALEDARYAIESTRKQYVIGEDCARLELLEADLSAQIAEDVRALNEGDGE